ncbi:RNA-splicing ligase RtcB [Clostridium puniceum]|uniref:3'-phosphate/5'-hydroxy nucleic acid ligase n=1 Tax=Clostridium puniceum TaxID=29367 RepID=A0A1S8T1Z4_9CLOT|nr:RtcB family protein [Clostridium puniceum]OOM71485.1 RNA-splicing ligase RtcB [Clostridium puniceum]
MLEVKGKYNTAKVFTDNIEIEAIEQLRELCNQPFVEGCKVRIMPDTHKGAGSVIGFTADLGDKVIPNIVGVDIGCGMLTVNLGKMDFNLENLDKIIHENIPSGMNVHKGKVAKFPQLQDLKCYRNLKNTKRIERSIGTLGGGNHFIEINESTDGTKYLVIHSGSRNLGNQVASMYQNLAIDLCSGKGEYFIKRDKIIEEYKAEGRRKEIQKALKELDALYNNLMPSYPRGLCFLNGNYKDEYLHDMNICQQYATLNRETMADIILKKLLGKGFEEFESFSTIHNYINFKDNIIRKGSISAYEGEKVLIPLNMRDGSIIAIGKGNPDWNYSAPHGAGRIMSRTKAKQEVKFEDFKASMEGIFTTSVTVATLDEAPMAYKSKEEILDNISETVDIIEIIKPIYNFKAQG